MKRMLVGGIATAMGLFAMLGSALAQAEFNLRWAHYLPNGPFLEVEESFAKRVTERTNGKVKITIAYAGALGSAYETLTLAGRGAVDFASIAPGYYPDHLAFWKASQIPFLFDSPDEAINVFQTLVKEFPAYKEEMDRLNVHFLFQQPLGSYYLSGSGENCDTLSGLAGKKIRAFGSDIPKIFAAAGATPITLTTTEIYEALQRGTLDYSNVDIGNIAALKLYQVGKYTCGPIMTFNGHLIVIGKRTWNRLPAEYQQILTEEAASAQKRYLEWLANNSERAIKAITEGGGVVKKFPDAELAKWKAATPDLLQGWVDEATKRGHGESAGKVAERWRELLK